MSALLTEILVAQASPRPRSPDHVRAFYIQHPDQVASLVAEDADGALVGFQSLKIARAGNAYALPPGWGIIGTYVATAQARRGIGRALFQATGSAARDAGITRIDATIGAGNGAGLAYYKSLGFVPYRSLAGAVGTVCALDPELPPGG